jgi:hypothetical protein
LGNLWLFGGVDVSDISGLDRCFNDLWRWDGATWTWMGGADQPDGYGVYGTKGVADPANVPGARYGAAAWLDGSGALWVFGGGRSYLDTYNDLWRWDGANWTWVGGSSTANDPGVHGTRGTPAALNIPGARSGSAFWTDSRGRFWLFGGIRAPLFQSFFYDDLWMFDGVSWMWVSGTGTDSLGVYGAKGVPNPANGPGGRSNVASWKDSRGDFWIFGGWDSLGHSNELWRWDGANWTWMSGSSQREQLGSYGVMGVRSVTSVPGSRSGAVAWTGSGQDLWLFGGEGSGEVLSGDLKDLWRWDGASWTWISGSKGINQSGTYGTLGRPSAANQPGARTGSAAWSGDAGTLWLFGGNGYDSQPYPAYSLGDLWSLSFGCPPLVVSPAALPGAAFGNPYAQPLVASNGVAPYRFEIVSGSLPAGMTLSSSGTVYGTPSTCGTFGFTASATDSAGGSGERPYTLSVACPALVATVSGGGTVCPGASATVTVTVSGGTPPYTVSLTNGGGTLSGPGPVLQFTVSPASTTTYAVQSVTDGVASVGAGSGSAIVGIKARPSPPTTNGRISTCEGSWVYLSADYVPGATYAWTGPNGFSSTFQLPPMFPSPPAGEWVYSVVITVEGCTSLPGTTTVVVNPTPAAPVITAPSSVSPFQVGVMASVPYRAGFTYSWWVSNGTITSGSGTNQITFFTGASGPVYVTLGETSDAGCSAPQSSLSIPMVVPPTSLRLLSPCRLFDTRNVSGPDAASPALGGGETRTLQASGRCGVPATAKAISVNVTATDQQQSGELLLYPTDLTSAPTASMLSFPPGKTRASNAIVELARDGSGTFKVRSSSSGPVQFILDVNGYFE